MTAKLSAAMTAKSLECPAGTQTELIVADEDAFLPNRYQESTRYMKNIYKKNRMSRPIPPTGPRARRL